MKRYYINSEENGITFNNKLILIQYKEYRNEKKTLGKNYIELWEHRNIFI